MCILCGGDPSDQATDHTITHPFDSNPDERFECLTCERHISEHPDKIEVLAKMEMETIIEHGHEVRVIFPDEPGPGMFAYSVGRSVKDRPELLVTGNLPPEVLGHIINRVAEIDDETPLVAGVDLDEVLDGFRVRLVEVRDMDEAEMFGVTTHFGTEETSALQILWPDADGRFPGEEGFGYTPEQQPVYA